MSTNNSVQNTTNALNRFSTTNLEYANDRLVVQDGITSVALDTDLLATAAGLTLTGSDRTVEPISQEFAVGFDITEDSDFLFNNQNGFTPLEAEIEHTGTVTFDSVIGEITVGDFTIGFDAARQTDELSGFFVQNTVDGAVDDLILFDLGNPDSLEVDSDSLEIPQADLLVASEFAHVLSSTGLATDDLTGADVGDAAINAVAEPLEVSIDFV